MFNYHLDGQSVVDIHEESVHSIMTLSYNGGCVDSGNGIEICSVVGIFTVVEYHIYYAAS